MQGRRLRSARLVAVTVLVLLALTSPHAVSMLRPTRCLTCPANCPMHAKHLGCHEKAGVSPAHAPRAPGLHCANCTGAAAGFTLTDQPAVLPAALNATTVAWQPDGVAPRVLPPADVPLDPPFHPPTRVSLSA